MCTQNAFHKTLTPSCSQNNLRTKLTQQNMERPTPALVAHLSCTPSTRKMSFRADPGHPRHARNILACVRSACFQSILPTYIFTTYICSVFTEYTYIYTCRRHVFTTQILGGYISSRYVYIYIYICVYFYEYYIYTCIYIYIYDGNIFCCLSELIPDIRDMQSGEKYRSESIFVMHVGPNNLEAYWIYLFI